MKPTNKLVVVVLVLLVLGISQAAVADTLFCTAGATGAGCASATTASVSGNNGAAVNAGASIGYSNHTVTVTLTNWLVDPKSVSQNISDVYFQIAGASATGGLITSSGTSLVSVASGGGTTFSTGDVTWNLVMSGDTFHLTDLIGNSPTTPAKTIIGAPNTVSGLYGNANGSIAGSGPHNPFVNQTVTFVINGVTGGSTIGNVDISFGTTDSSVPEPASMLLLGSGLSALGIFGRRKFRK